MFPIELDPRCFCNDMPGPIIIHNEMMVKNVEYEWDLDLKNAKTDRFKKLKKRAEDSLDKFYLQSPKMGDLGYQGYNSTGLINLCK